MSQILKAYFFCPFLGYNLYFFSRFFVLFLCDELVATLYLSLVSQTCKIAFRSGMWGHGRVELNLYVEVCLMYALCLNYFPIQISLLNLPPCEGQDTTVSVIELSPASMACPKDTCKYK